MLSISVVIPTRDRASALVETLEACRRHAGPVELEFIVVDLGSRDDTGERLDALAAAEPRLRWERLDGALSAASARNRGAALARHDLVLFFADTLHPGDAGFFKAHAEVHERFPATGTAVQGRVTWAERPQAGSDLLEPLPQDAGGPGELTPYAWHDWAAVRSLNLSVKRTLVADWEADGFRADLAPDPDGGALDGVELARRLSAAGGVEFRMFHTSAAAALDARGWSLERLMSRHVAAGGLARLLEDPAALGLGSVAAALSRPGGPGDPGIIADYLAMIEGVKAWARLFDANGGSSGEALKPALALALAEGYLLHAPPGANLPEGCRAALDAFRQRVNRVTQSVATGLPVDAGAVPAGAAAPAWRGPRLGLVGRLRAWARQKPALVRVYLWLRAVQGR